MTLSKAKVSSGLSVSILGKYFGIQNYYSMFCPLFDNFIIKKFEFWKYTVFWLKKIRVLFRAHIVLNTKQQRNYRTIKISKLYELSESYSENSIRYGLGLFAESY